MSRYLIRTFIILLTAFHVSVVPAKEAHHPHHLGVAFGGAGHGSETSGFLGLDYMYRFKNDVAAFLFFEGVSGDFEVEAYGAGIGKYFDSGWKISAGPGVEKKLKSGENLNLFHVSTGYDWHSGHWSYGPTATVDFIEQSHDTYYLGWTFGYGF